MYFFLIVVFSFGMDIDFEKIQSESKCQEINVDETNKLYELNGLFIGWDTFQQSQIPYLDHNTLEIDVEYSHLQDINFQIIDSLQLDEKNSEICSLIQNNSENLYYLKCIKVVMGQEKVDINRTYEYSVAIQSSENTQCKQLSFYNGQFYLLCIKYQREAKLIVISKLDNEIKQFDLQIVSEKLTQCKIKQQIYLDEIFLGLYCCEDWGLYRIVIQGEKLQINELEMISVIQEKKLENDQLIDFLFKFNEDKQKDKIKNFWLMFKDGFYNLENANLMEFIPLIQDLQRELFNDQYMSCPSKSLLAEYILQYLVQSQLSQDLLISILQNEQIINDVKQHPKIYFISLRQQLLHYESKIVNLINHQFRSSINVNLQEIYPLSHQWHRFIGITQDFKFILFKKKPLQYYYPYGNVSQKYVQLYKSIRLQEYKYAQCFVRLENSNNTSFNLEIIDQFSGKLQFFDQNTKNIVSLSRKSIISNVPYDVKLINSSHSENIQISYIYNFDDICNFTSQFPEQLGYFLIYEQYGQISIIFQNQNNSLVIFNCQAQNFQYFVIQIDLNDETIFVNQNVYFLDRSRTKLYQLENVAYKISQVQLIYEFNNQMKFGGIKNGEYLHIISDQSFLDRQIFLIKTIDKPIIIMPNLSELNLNKEPDIQFLQIGQDVSFIQKANEIEFIIMNSFTKVIQIDLEILSAQCLYDQFDDIHCILVGLRKNNYQKLEKYLVTKYDFTLLNQFFIDEYYVLMPLKYSFISSNLNILLIAAEKNKKQFLLLFNINQENNIQLQSIIQCGNMYFSLSNQYIYYYNINQKFVCFDHQKVSFEFKTWTNNKFAEKIDLLLEFVSNKDERLSKVQNLYVTFQPNNLRAIFNFDNIILLKNNKGNMNIRKYLQGPISDIQLINSPLIELKNPLNLIHTYYCKMYISIYCVNYTNDNYYFVNMFSNSVINFQWQDVKVENIALFVQIPDSGTFLMLESNLQKTHFSFCKSLASHVEVLIEEQPFNKGSYSQNLLSVIYPNQTMLYYFSQTDILPVKSLEYFDNFYLLHIKNDYYAYMIYFPNSFELNIFQIINQQFRTVNYINVTKQYIEQLLLDQHDFPLKIQIQKVFLLKCTIDSNDQTISGVLIVLNSSVYFFTITFTIDLDSSKADVSVQNIKKQVSYNHSTISSVFLIKEKYLILSNIKILNIYNFEDGNENIYSIYEYSLRKKRVLPLNNTVFAIQNFENQSFIIDIVTAQKWKLVVKNKSDRVISVQLKANDYLNNQIDLQLIGIIENTKIRWSYFYLLSICQFIIINVLCFFRRNKQSNHNIKHQKIIGN